MRRRPNFGRSAAPHPYVDGDTMADVMLTDTPPLFREVAAVLVKTTLVVIALTIVYPYVIGALARAFGH
jgi:hypothetical protein